MTKGDDRKITILEIGLDIASRLGLEAVTIGSLAKAANMSKSGLFAHFQSKENLQIELLKYAGEMFSRDVVVPALAVPAGIPRIRSLVENWIRYSGCLTGGCIFVTASTDFKDRPGKVKDFLLKQQDAWIDSLRRIASSAIEAGDFRKVHLYYTLLDSTDTQKRQQAALEQLLRAYREAPAAIAKGDA
jgi:AcrR family transcriptional regulator